jgi:hypothetical protein
MLTSFRFDPGTGEWVGVEAAEETEPEYHIHWEHAVTGETGYGKPFGSKVYVEQVASGETISSHESGWPIWHWACNDTHEEELEADSIEEVLTVEADDSMTVVWDNPSPERLYLWNGVDSVEVGYMTWQSDFMIVLTAPFRVDETEQVLEPGTVLHMEDK